MFIRIHYYVKCENTIFICIRLYGKKKVLNRKQNQTSTM